MIKNFYITFILLTLGFLLMPMSGFACESKVDRSCCKKEMSEKKIKKDCCSTKSDNKNNNKNDNKKDNNCGGKCGHSNCTTSTTLNFSLISFYEIHFNNNNFDLTSEKSKFYHSEISVSAGFTSVWSIPKIG